MSQENYLSITVEAMPLVNDFGDVVCVMIKLGDEIIMVDV